MDAASPCAVGFDGDDDDVCDLDEDQSAEESLQE